MYYDKYQAKMLSFKQKHDPYQAKICLEVGKYDSEYIKSRLLNKDSFQERPSLCLLPALAQGIERSVSWRVQLAQVSQGSTHVCK